MNRRKVWSVSAFALAVMGIGTAEAQIYNPVAPVGASDISGLTSLTSGSAQARAQSSRGQDLGFNMLDYMLAIETDATNGFIRAQNAAVAAYNAGYPSYIYFPAKGSPYSFNTSTALPIFNKTPIGIKGDGSRASVIVLGLNYSGDVFSWSNCWQGTTYNNGKYPASQNSTGPFVRDIGFVGNLNSSNVVNALNFYDLIDFADVSDVEFDFIPGACLKFGYVSTLPGVTGNGETRESRFGRLRMWYCGTSTVPNIDIFGSGTAAGSNYLTFTNWDMYTPNGEGMVIHNNSTGPLHLITSIDGRVENYKSNAIRIGDATYAGRIYGNTFIRTKLVAGIANSVALYATAPNSTASALITQNKFDLEIDNSAGNGIYLNAGATWLFDCIQNQCAQTEFTATASVAGTIQFATAPDIDTWIVSVDPTVVGNVFIPLKLSLNNQFVRNAGISASTYYRHASVAMLLQLATTGTTPGELTADGTSTINANNIFSLSSTLSLATFDIIISGVDKTNAGNWYSYAMYGAKLYRSGAMTYKAASAGAIIDSAGTGSGTAVALTANATYNGLDVVVTPPSADTWDWTAEIRAVLAA